MPLPHALLAVFDAAQISGPGRQLVALLRELRIRGIDARLMMFQRAGGSPSGLVGHAQEAGIPVQVIDESGPFDLGRLSRVRHALHEFGPEVVQTHSYKAPVLAWLLRATGERFRWVGCYHGSTAEDRKVQVYHWLDRRLLRSADQLILMAESQRTGFGRAGKRARIIHNAILRPPDQRKDSATSPIQAIFAYLGRLSHEKGCDILLEAVASLEREGLEEPWSVVIAGDGPERPSLERQAGLLNCPLRVNFVWYLADPWII